MDKTIITEAVQFDCAYNETADSCHSSVIAIMVFFFLPSKSYCVMLEEDNS